MFITQLLVSRLSLFKELSAELAESRNADWVKPCQPMNDPASKFYGILLQGASQQL